MEICCVLFDIPPERHRSELKGKMPLERMRMERIWVDTAWTHVCMISFKHILYLIICIISFSHMSYIIYYIYTIYNLLYIYGRSIRYGASRRFQQDYWEPARRFLLSDSFFVAKLRALSPSEVSEPQKKRIRRYLKSPELARERVSNCSRAAVELLSWAPRAADLRARRGLDSGGTLT